MTTPDWRHSRIEREKQIYDRLRLQRACGVVTGCDSDLALRAYREACEESRLAVRMYNERVETVGKRKRGEAA